MAHVMVMDARVSAHDQVQNTATDGSPHPQSATKPYAATTGQLRAAPRWPWILLRITTVLLAADAFLQPVLAGRFLSGDFGMLAAHEHNATYGVFILAVVQIVVTAFAWRRSGGPGWLVVVATVIAGAVLLQVIMGFDRILGIHIPLGVAIIGTIGWLAVWVCSHQPHDRPFTLPRRDAASR